MYWWGILIVVMILPSDWHRVGFFNYGSSASLLRIQQLWFIHTVRFTFNLLYSLDSHDTHLLNNLHFTHIVAIPNSISTWSLTWLIQFQIVCLHPPTIGSDVVTMLLWSTLKIMHSTLALSPRSYISTVMASVDLMRSTFSSAITPLSSSEFLTFVTSATTFHGLWPY